MSSRDWFWFLAGVLVTFAIMATVRAWLRERPAQAVKPSIPAFAVPIAAALALIGVALGIYFMLGSPDSIASSHGTQSAGAMSAGPVSAGQSAESSMETRGTSASAGSLDDVTRKLAARLASKGGSDSEWKLLAESYDYMGLAAEAKAARAHIASAASPSDSNATNDVTTDQMAAVAEALDNHPAGGNGNSAPTRADPASADPAHAEISGTVEIASKLASRAGTGATLFIYAKQPNAPGPPLAVIRIQASHWPVAFTLSDANAMVPGRNLSNADSVQIEARISRNGDALQQSGDLVGSVTRVNPRGGHPVKISIDKEIG